MAGMIAAAAVFAALICCAAADGVGDGGTRHPLQDGVDADGHSSDVHLGDAYLGDGADEHDVIESQDARQGVDDWTPSQVAHWLRKEAISPWPHDEYLAALEAHDIDGHLLLSLHPPDILHVLDADMEQQRPEDFQRNLGMLNAKLEELRLAIAQVRMQKEPTQTSP